MKNKIRKIPKIYQSGRDPRMFLRLKPKKGYRKRYLNFHRRKPDRDDRDTWYVSKMASIVINWRFKAMKFVSCAYIRNRLIEIREHTSWN